MTSQELENIETVRRFLFAPYSETTSHRTPNYVLHRAGILHLPDIFGLTAAEQAKRLDHDAQPGLSDRHDSIDQIVCRDDRVWVQWTVRARHTGNLFGIPATGKPVELIEVSIFRIEEGKIAEGWFIADELGLLLQLGADADILRSSLTAGELSNHKIEGVQ